MYKRRTQNILEYADFALLEIVCINIAYVVAYCLRHGWSRIPYEVPEYLFLAGIISLLDIVMMLLFDPFSRVLKRGPYREFLASLRHIMLVFAGLTFYLFSVQESATYSRISIYLTFLFDFILGYCVRLLYRRTRCARKTHQRSMLVVTDGTDTEELLKAIAEDDDNGILIRGICLIDGEVAEKSEDFYDEAEKNKKDNIKRKKERANKIINGIRIKKKKMLTNSLRSVRLKRKVKLRVFL